MSVIKRVFDGLSAISPDIFQAEVAAGLGYGVILFNLHISDAQRAAGLGAAVLVFMVLQAAYKLASGK